MVARIFGRTENALGRRCDLLEGGPVGEDHDLVVKVRPFRAPEKCGATGLGEKEEGDAREARAGGVHAEEWSEESGRHGVGVVVGVVVFLGGMDAAVAVHVCGGGS